MDAFEEGEEEPPLVWNIVPPILFLLFLALVYRFFVMADYSQKEESEVPSAIVDEQEDEKGGEEECDSPPPYSQAGKW